MLTAVKKCVFILEVLENISIERNARLIIGTLAAKMDSDAFISNTYSL
jgi:hypothetical protein